MRRYHFPQMLSFPLPPRIPTFGSKAGGFYTGALTRRRRIDPYETGELGLTGLDDTPSVGATITSLGSALGGVGPQLAELRQALTITTACSVAAALGVVFLLVRTAK